MHNGKKIRTVLRLDDRGVGYWGWVGLFGGVWVITILLLGLPPIASGDVLIHFVFARNMMAGDWFVYGYEQISRAGTSFLWEVLLALVGFIGTRGGDLRPEAWTWIARALAVLFTSLSGLILWRMLREHLPSTRQRALVLVATGANPVLWYWFFAQPMETSLATLLVCGFLAWKYGRRGAPSHPVAYGAGCAGFAFLFFLTRPELAVLPGFTAGLQFVLRRDRRSFLAGGTAIAFLGLFLGAWFLLLWIGDYALFPTAATARRIHMRTNQFPGTSIWYSPDALVYGVILLGYGALVWKRPHREKWGTPLLVTLAVGLLFSVCFFGFYYTSIWRGRYLLPMMIPWIAWATATWIRQPSRRRAGAGLILLACIYGLFLFPIHRRQQKPIWKQWGSRAEAVDYIAPDFKPGTRVLAQEVQGALFFPELVYISTDGLIGGEAYDAYIRDLTVWEFWWEQQPDLMTVERYYLPDPEGVLDVLRDAAAQGHSRFVIHGLPFERFGRIRGTGMAYRPLWNEADQERVDLL